MHWLGYLVAIFVLAPIAVAVLWIGCRLLYDLLSTIITNLRKG